MTIPPEATKTWAVLELFGHARIAGSVSEHTFGGETFTRVDVPEVSYEEPVCLDGVRTQQTRVISAHTKLLAAHRIKHEPIRAWELSEALEQLPLSDRRALLSGPA